MYKTRITTFYRVVWAVEKFDYYLEGNKFKIITDHTALKWLFNKKEPKGRIARWIIRIQPYICNMEVIHKSGRKHMNADALSRIRFEQEISNEVL